MSDSEMSVPVERRAEVLAALYNHSRPVGMGVLHARPNMTAAEAEACFVKGDDRARMFPKQRDPKTDEFGFDYLYGRPLKLTFKGETLRGLHLYDRDNGGTGTARRIIEAVLSAPPV